MGDKTGIEFDTITLIVDRGGRRTRIYYRKNSSSPGRRERMSKAVEGLKWCRGCCTWLATETVSSGVCRSCANSEERVRYKTSEKFREYRKDRRDHRRRLVDRMPVEATELIEELFGGICAYCDRKATSWDHFIPVSRGGQTIPGNMLPACGSCNSRKNDMDPLEWLDKIPVVKPFTVEYLAIAGDL